jgi:hypothetical protein
VFAAAQLPNNQTAHTSPHFAFKAVHPDSGESVEYKSLLTRSTGPAWEQANCDEIGGLAQGHQRPDGTTVPGTETINFIHVHQPPPRLQGHLLENRRR